MLTPVIVQYLAIRIIQRPRKSRVEENVFRRSSLRHILNEVFKEPLEFS